MTLVKLKKDQDGRPPGPVRGRELVFAEPSVDSFSEAYRKVVGAGARQISLRPFNEFAARLIEKLNPTGNERIYAQDVERGVSLPNGVTLGGPNRRVDATFVCASESKDVSRLLMECADPASGSIVAAITDDHSSRRPVFVNSIPKSGTHLLFTLLAAFGLMPPASLDLPSFDSEIAAGRYYNLQHLTVESMGQQYKSMAGFLHQFCRSVVLFAYRDPRDIAVSLAFYLARQKDYHVLKSYMESLPESGRLQAVISGNYPIPIFLNRYTRFRGTIRDLVLMYREWFSEPFSNTLPVSFENLVGPSGGGDDLVQLHTIWRLQLALHVAGRPSDFAARMVTRDTLTFRKGQIGSYKSSFTDDHTRTFQELPQDFMAFLGYSADRLRSTARNSSADSTSGTRSVGARFLGRIDIDEDFAPVLIKSVEDTAIVFYNGRYYAMPTSLGPIDLASLDPVALAALESADSLEAIQARAVTRTAALLAQGTDDDSAPRVIEKAYLGYNLVSYRGRVHAISQAIGPIDLEAADAAILSGSTTHFVCGSVEEAKAAVEQNLKAEINAHAEAALAAGREREAYLEKMLATALDTLRSVEQRADDLLGDQRAAETRRAGLDVELERARNETVLVKTAADEAAVRSAAEIERARHETARVKTASIGEREELGRAHEELTEAVDRLQREAGELRHSLQLTIAERNIARAALEQSRHAEARAETRVVQLLEQVGEHQGDLEARRSAIDRLSRELTAARENLARRSADVEHLESQERVLRAWIERLQNELVQQRARQPFRFWLGSAPQDRGRRER